MKLKTRLFELENGSMVKLAVTLHLSLSYLYRIKRGERKIGEKFIVGVLVAFPRYKFEDLFYIEDK